MMSGNSALEIGGLADLDLPALREHWRELYGSEPPVRMSTAAAALHLRAA